MKYIESQYIGALESYFGPSEDDRNNTYSLVTTRKEHECMGMTHKGHYGTSPIPRGSLVGRETAIHEELGRVNCYVCIPCLDKWADELFRA